MGPTPKSLILDLLSTLREGAMPVAALVEAGVLFGLGENGIRVAVSRLLAQGRIERDERGRYRLGRDARAVQARVASWRQLDRRTVSWDGTWLALHGAHAAGRRRRDPARVFLGFRPLSRELRLRPANLADGVPGVREALASLEGTGACFASRLSELDPVSQARARRLWDGEALVGGYRRSLAELEASTDRLASLEPGAAMVESFRVGGRAIRQLVLDPLLPEELLPSEGAAERGRLAGALREYDRLGRTLWGAFLARHGVPHRAAPVDTHLAVARADRLEGPSGATPTAASGGSA